ncbi:MAG: methyltransferase domain-containing protein [Candidatus Latescibacterota bacterium]|nr:methyltransferase domain-containing protein [Candidatus Latescibacterota bacterium]
MAKKKDKKSKSTKRTAYGVTILKSNHKRIRALKKSHEPDIHGNKLWNSSYLIMDYLKHQGLPVGSRVMEVGCGWGLLGIYCAKQFDAEVVGVDADPKVFPYLHLHAEANGVSLQTRKSRFEDLKKRHLADTKLVVGADICFWDEMVDPLYSMIRKAMRSGVEQIIIADPGRPPFDEVCEKAEKKFDAEVKEWEVKKPGKAQGWLLIVGSLPTNGSV